MTACVMDFLCGSDRFGEEFVDSVVPAGHGADTDVLAAEGFVVGDGLFGVVENSVVAEMRDAAGQAGGFELFCEPVSFVSAGTGNLNGGITDISHFFQGFRKIVEGFAVVAQGVKLCTDFNVGCLLSE
jgi:hypothetical protein